MVRSVLLMKELGIRDRKIIRTFYEKCIFLFTTVGDH